MTPPRWQAALAILQNDMPSDSRADIDATLKEAFCQGRGATPRGGAAGGGRGAAAGRLSEGGQVKGEGAGDGGGGGSGAGADAQAGYSTLVDIFDEFDYEPIASASIAQV